MTTSTAATPAPEAIDSVSAYEPAVEPPRSANSSTVAFVWGARVPDVGVAVSQAADSDTVQASGRPPAFEIVTDAAVPAVPKSTSSGETASRAGDATTTDSATVR